MTIIFLEGFENYGPVDTAGPTLAAAMQARWNFANANGTAKIIDGRCGGKALQILVGDQIYEASQFVVAFESTSHITVGMAFYYGAQDRTESIYNINAKWWGLLINDQIQLRCNIDYTGAVWFTVPDQFENNTTRFYTSQMKTQGWHYYEWKIFLDTSGSIETRIDGTVVSTVIGVDIGTACNGLYLCAYKSPSQLWAYDDLYIKTGITAQDYLGLICIESIRPLSDVVEDWSGIPSHEIVATNIFDANNYVNSETINEVDTWNCGPINLIDTNIVATQLVALGKAATGGGRQLDIICESNTNEVVSVSKILSLSETNLSLVLEKDPNGLVPWSANAVEAANYSIRVGD